MGEGGHLVPEEVERGLRREFGAVVPVPEEGHLLLALVDPDGRVAYAQVTAANLAEAPEIVIEHLARNLT